jgi:hypothetical protein
MERRRRKAATVAAAGAVTLGQAIAAVALGAGLQLELSEAWEPVSVPEATVSVQALI